MHTADNENSLQVDEIMKDWYTHGEYNREDSKLKRGEKIRTKNWQTKNLKWKGQPYWSIHNSNGVIVITPYCLHWHTEMPHSKTHFKQGV